MKASARAMKTVLIVAMIPYLYLPFAGSLEAGKAMADHFGDMLVRNESNELKVNGRCELFARISASSNVSGFCQKSPEVIQIVLDACAALAVVTLMITISVSVVILTVLRDLFIFSQTNHTAWCFHTLFCTLWDYFVASEEERKVLVILESIDAAKNHPVHFITWRPDEKKPESV